VHIRNPAPDGGPDDGRPSEQAGDVSPDRAAQPGRRSEPEQPGPRSYAVPTWVASAKAAGAVILAVAALLVGDPLARWVGLLAAAVLAVLAARDLALRVRLRVDPEGVELVRGWRRQRIPWSGIERVHIDEKPQRGIRTALLEFDAGEEIFQFGRYDLGADPLTVLDEVATVCPQETSVVRPEKPDDEWPDDGPDREQRD
jgi:hypothetical protein